MRTRRLLVFVPVLLLAFGCSTSGSRPDGVAAPDVTIRVANKPFFGSGVTAPITLEATVTNRASVPITVRSVRISSPNMGQYTIRPEERFISQTLAPGESKTFLLPATAIASGSGLMISEPLNVRADINFEAAGRRFHEIYNIVGIMI